MKFVVLSQDLLKKITFLNGVIASNNSMAILDHFLFEISGNDLKITASDLETTMSSKLNIESEINVSIAVPAKLLLEILKTLKTQPLAFSINENNTIEISSDSGKYSLAYSKGEEFPKAIELEDPSTTLIPSDVLGTAISKTIFATGNDDLRPVMAGVLFQISLDKITFVATDAHKLVKYQRSDIKASQESEFVVPKKPLNILKSILPNTDDEVKIEFNKSNTRFSFEDYTLTCRLVDAKYPNYNAVIPKDNPNLLTINRSELLSAVKRTSIFSSKETHQVRLNISGMQLEVSAEDANYSNKANEILLCNYKGDPLRIGFNSKYLHEMLSNLKSEEIQIELSQPNRAGIITPVDGVDVSEQILMLVMPSLIS